MCGLIIADSYRYTPAQVLAGVEAMKHRGADGLMGVAETSSFTVGHTRLAIRGGSPESNQPFITPTGEVRAFVGEFFQTDNERGFLDEVFEGYLNPLHKADGFWATCQVGGAWEVAVVDHLGIKPLYYWPDRGLVCSEIKPMLRMAGGAPRFNEQYLANCIKWGYDYSGRTAFDGIFQVPPGHFLNLKSWRVAQYWHWDRVPSSGLRDTLDWAIQNRMKGDREVALLLSGGLDSSIVYYSLKAQGFNPRAFSLENGEGEFLPAGVTVLEPPAESTTQEALSIVEAPLDLGSLLPQVTLALAVGSAGFRVCLSGDGADELFGGYSRAQQYDSQYSDTFCELPYYHLPRLDKVMMSQTIELRSPFLAPSVVANALLTKYELRKRKECLKYAYADLLPDSVLYRSKTPLKTKAVQEGGLAYRCNLVKEFRSVFANLQIQP